MRTRHHLLPSTLSEWGLNFNKFFCKKKCQPVARKLAEFPSGLAERVETGPVVVALGVVAAIDHSLLDQHQGDLVLQSAT